MTIGFSYFKNASVTAINDISASDGAFIVSDGTKWVGESTSTARTSLGLGSIATQDGNQDLETTDSPTFAALSLGTGELTAGSINRTTGTLSLEIGGSAKISAVSAGATITGNLNLTNQPSFIGIGQSNDKSGTIMLQALNSTTPWTDTTNTDRYGLNISPYMKKTSAAYTGTLWGFYSTANMDAANTQNWSTADGGIIAMEGQCILRSGAAGIVTLAIGIKAGLNNASGGTATVTNWRGISIPDVTGSVITNNYALYIEDQTTGGTLNYSIYSAGGLNYLAEQLTVADGDIIGGADGSAQGRLTLWDGSGGNTPAYILLHSPNGTAHYLFVEDDGTVKQHTAAPTQNSDGNVVGAQT